MSDETYGRLMPFLDDSESYVLGFEVGKIWGYCDYMRFPEGMMVHTKNLPQIELIAKHFKQQCVVDSVGHDEWCVITFAPLVPEQVTSLQGVK